MIWPHTLGEAGLYYQQRPFCAFIMQPKCPRKGREFKGGEVDKEKVHRKNPSPESQENGPINYFSISHYGHQVGEHNFSDFTISKYSTGSWTYFILWNAFTSVPAAALEADCLISLSVIYLIYNQQFQLHCFTPRSESEFWLVTNSEWMQLMVSDHSVIQLSENFLNAAFWLRTKKGLKWKPASIFYSLQISFYLSWR
jgi:hypothetical protein